MFQVDYNDERLKAYMLEVDSIFDECYIEIREEKQDDRPLIEKVLDPNFVYIDKSPTEFKVQTTRGVADHEKSELQLVCAEQGFCENPTTVVPPILPSRGCKSTGQLKLFIDVFSMLRYVQKSDRVLVIGSSSEWRMSGMAYFLLAGYVREVHMYDVYEKPQEQMVIDGTVFKFFKEYWKQKEVSEYDVVFDDAWRDGEPLHHVLKVRVFSQKVTKPREYIKEMRLLGGVRQIFWYGQVHTRELRASNVERLYRGYNHVGICNACIELGYFGGQLTVFQRFLLAQCHQMIRCTSSQDIPIRRTVTTADLLMGVAGSDYIHYELGKSGLVDEVTRKTLKRDSIYRVHGTILKRLVGTQAGSVVLTFRDVCSSWLNHELVVDVDMGSVLLKRMDNIVVALHKCFLAIPVSQFQGGCKEWVGREYDSYFVTPEVDQLIVSYDDYYEDVVVMVKFEFWRMTRFQFRWMLYEIMEPIRRLVRVDK